MSNKITILDGGMGRQLKAMGAPFGQPEWSARALMEAPETVKQAHQGFINAGAQIITTNTYAVIPFHIGQEKFNSEAADLIALAAKIARNVADKTTSHNVKIAGCLPPAFGSYQPELFNAEKAADIYAPLIEHQKNNIDFWLAETITSIAEATIVNNLIKNSGKDFWLAYNLADREDKALAPSLRSGETVEEAVQAALDMKVGAILFNCSQPEEMTDALKITNQMNIPIPIGVYANSFASRKDIAANKGLRELRDDITPTEYLGFAKQWQNLGATIIGGCCGIGPEHISALSVLND